MALNPLTLSVSNGIQGRHFRSAVSGATAGNVVDVLPGSAPGFGISNGVLSNPSLSYDANLVILQERNPTTGENRTTNLIISAIGQYALKQQALSIDASYRTYRTAAVRQPDGTDIWNIFVEGATGATVANALAGGTVPTIAFSGAVSQAEGNSGNTDMTFVLNLTRNGISGNINFTWTFTGGTAVPDDFTDGQIPSGTGTFLAGQNSANIVIGIAGDTSVETDDTLQITATLDAYPSATATVLGTIQNDDFYTLGTLTLSDQSFVTGTAKTVSVGGATGGSTLSLVSPPTGFTINSGARTVTYDGTGTSGAKTLTIRETLATATNTPNDTAFNFSVSDPVGSYNAPYLLDVSAPAANSLLTAQPGWTTTIGTTSGFKFSGTTQRLAVPNLTNTGVFRDVGSPDMYWRQIINPASLSTRQRYYLRFTDFSNNIYIEINPNSGAPLITIVKTIAGTATTILNALFSPISFGGYEQVEARIVGGILSLYQGGGGMSLKGATKTGNYDVSGVPSSQLVGFGANNSSYYNAEIGPLVATTRRFTINEVPKVIQRERSGANTGKGAVIFGGAYNGPVPDRYRVFDSATGTDIIAATAFTAVTGSGNWTGPTIYLDGATTEYRIEVWCNDLPLSKARTNGFYVGERIRLYGQSGANEMGIYTASAGGVPAYTHNAAAWSVRGSLTATYWTRFQSDSSGTYTNGYYGLGKLGSDLADALGVAVGIECVGSGGQHIADLQKGATSGAQLYSKPGEDISTSTSMAALSAMYGKIGTLIWVHQGASDIPGATSAYVSYFNAMTQLFNDIRADFGIGSGGADMNVLIDIIDIDSTGSTTDTTSGNAVGFTNVRMAHHDYGMRTPISGLGLTTPPAKSYVAAACMDAPHAAGDGLHRSSPGYYLTQQRWFRTLKKIFLGTGTDGLGPMPTGVTRSGSDLIIQYSANGCTGLAKGAGTLPANFQVGTDNTFGTILTPTSYDVDSVAMTVTLHFGSTVPAGASVRTFQTSGLTQADLAVGTYSDGTPNCVLYPIFHAMTAS